MVEFGMEYRRSDFNEIRVSSWEQAREVSSHFQSWRFRGQSDSRWKLCTSLQRVVESNGLDVRDTVRLEKAIIDKFQRRARKYIDNAPENSQIFEWMSHIQHYGGPTRLLDLTHSFYIAAFFAIESATTDAAIFCLNEPLLSELSREKFEGRQDRIDITLNSYEIFDRAYENNLKDPFIVIAEPFNLNERIAAQQGLFAIPFAVMNDFEYNLSLTLHPYRKHLPEFEVHSYDNDPIELVHSALIKIVLPKEILPDVKKDLLRMNINSSTLFPGLEGFSRSLGDEVFLGSFD